MTRAFPAVFVLCSLAGTALALPPVGLPNHPNGADNDADPVGFRGPPAGALPARGCGGDSISFDGSCRNLGWFRAHLSPDDAEIVDAGGVQTPDGDFVVLIERLHQGRSVRSVLVRDAQVRDRHWDLNPKYGPAHDLPFSMGPFNGPARGMYPAEEMILFNVDVGSSAVFLSTEFFSAGSDSWVLEEWVTREMRASSSTTTWSDRCAVAERIVSGCDQPFADPDSCVREEAALEGCDLGWYPEGEYYEQILYTTPECSAEATAAIGDRAYADCMLPYYAVGAFSASAGGAAVFFIGTGLGAGTTALPAFAAGVTAGASIAAGWAAVGVTECTAVSSETILDHRLENGCLGDETGADDCEEGAAVETSFVGDLQCTTTLYCGDMDGDGDCDECVETGETCTPLDGNNPFG